MGKDWIVYRLQTVGRVLAENGFPKEGKALGQLDPSDPNFRDCIYQCRQKIAPQTPTNTTLAIATIVLAELLEVEQ
jgi:hypothetical protein